MFLSLLSAVAFASPSGLGSPVHGGAFAGPSHTGVYGMAYTPTAVVGAERSLLLDVGVSRFYMMADLDSMDAFASRGVGPLPYFAYVAPKKRWGWGLQVASPYARVGDEAPDNPHRLYTISGSLIVLETRASLGFQLAEKWKAGLAFRGAYTIFESRAAMDTGTLMYQLIGPEAAPLIGDPLFEGEREITEGGGWGFGFAAGVAWQPKERLQLVIAMNSPTRSLLRGAMRLQPSKVFNLALEAEMEVDWRTPFELQMGLSVPVGPVDFHFHGEFVAWGAVSAIDATLRNPRVVSPDPLMETLLEENGLSDASALGGLESSADRGMHNVFAAGLMLSWAPQETLRFLVGAHYSPSAISLEWVSPANQDLGGLDYRSGLLWQASNVWELGWSADIFQVFPREVTQSVSDPRNLNGLPTTPSANGLYTLSVQRVGLSARARF